MYDYYHMIRQKSAIFCIMKRWRNSMLDKRKSALRKLYENKRRINQMRIVAFVVKRFCNKRYAVGLRDIISHSLKVKENSTLKILKDNRILKESLKIERESLNEQLTEFHKSKQSLEASKPLFIKETKNVLNNFIVGKLYTNITISSNKGIMSKLFKTWKIE